VRLAWQGDLRAWLLYQTGRWPRLKRVLAAACGVVLQAGGGKSPREARR